MTLTGHSGFVMASRLILTGRALPPRVAMAQQCVGRDDRKELLTVSSSGEQRVAFSQDGTVRRERDIML
jgi:hypothetical protein